MTKKRPDMVNLLNLELDQYTFEEVAGARRFGRSLHMHIDALVEEQKKMWKSAKEKGWYGEANFRRGQMLSLKRVQKLLHNTCA